MLNQVIKWKIVKVVSLIVLANFLQGNLYSQQDSIFAFHSWESTHHKGSSYSEKSISFNDGFGLIGIGIGVKGDNIRYVTMIGREIMPDGTLGTTTQVSNGTGKAETPIDADPMHFIVGIGVRVKGDNVVGIRIHTRRYDPYLKKLVGGLQSKTEGEWCCEEEIQAPNVSRDDLPYTIITGVGFNCKDDNINNVILRYSRLNL